LRGAELRRLGQRVDALAQIRAALQQPGARVAQ